MVPSKEAGERTDVLSQVLRLTLALQFAANGVERAFGRLGECIFSDENGCSVIYAPASGALHQNVCSTLFSAQVADLTRSSHWS